MPTCDSGTGIVVGPTDEVGGGVVGATGGGVMDGAGEKLDELSEFSCDTGTVVVAGVSGDVIL